MCIIRFKGLISYIRMKYHPSYVHYLNPFAPSYPIKMKYFISGCGSYRNWDCTYFFRMTKSWRSNDALFDHVYETSYLQFTQCLKSKHSPKNCQICNFGQLWKFGQIFPSWSKQFRVSKGLDVGHCTQSQNCTHLKRQRTTINLAWGDIQKNCAERQLRWYMNTNGDLILGGYLFGTRRKFEFFMPQYGPSKVTSTY